MSVVELECVVELGCRVELECVVELESVVELGSVVELESVVAVGKAGKTLKKAHNQSRQVRMRSWTQVPDEKVINSICYKV